MTKSLLVAVLAAPFLGFVTLQGASRKAVARSAGPENAGSTGADVPDGGRFVPGKILDRLEDGAPARTLEYLNRRNDARTEERLTGIRASVVDLPRELSVREAVRRYERLPDVEYAEPDFLLCPEATPGDTGYGQNSPGTIYACTSKGSRGAGSLTIGARTGWAIPPRALVCQAHGKGRGRRRGG